MLPSLWFGRMGVSISDQSGLFLIQLIWAIEIAIVVIVTSKCDGDTGEMKSTRVCYPHLHILMSHSEDKVLAGSRAGG